MVRFGIRSDKQSKPKSNVKLEASYNLLSQRKEFGFTIPEWRLFMHRYKRGYPVVSCRSRLNKIGTRCNWSSREEYRLKTSSHTVKWVQKGELKFHQGPSKVGWREPFQKVLAVMARSTPYTVSPVDLRKSGQPPLCTQSTEPMAGWPTVVSRKWGTVFWLGSGEPNPVWLVDRVHYSYRTQVL